MKKLLAVGVIVLFLSVSVIPSTGTTIVKKSPMPTPLGNILYVGGNGTANYSKIQDAIDDAWYGDTVFVYDDSSPYNENILINKTLNLIGENRNTTVIDGLGDRENSTVTITASDVYLSGFTVQNATRSNTYGVRIKEGNNTIINENIVKENYYGIFIYPPGERVSNGNIISYNIVRNCSFIGIKVAYSSDNVITHNSVYHNVYGIRYGGGISVGTGDNNTISHNDVRYNGVGINIDDADNTIVELNNIIQNVRGMATYSADDSEIRNNNIYQNKEIHCYNTYYRRQSLTINNNYWGRPRVLPKIIPGIRFIYLFSIRFLNEHGNYYWEPIFLPIPKIVYDRNPAQEPYNIGVG